MHDLHALFAERARTLAPGMYGGPGISTAPDAPIALSYGFAAPELFPRDDLLAATAAVLEHDAAEALNYGDPFPGLRDQVAARLRAQGVEAADDQVLLSYGSSQVLAVLPRVFIDPGDVVLIEGPSFIGAVRHFSDAGARLITIPTDAQGMDVDALEQQLRDLRSQGVRPKFIYTIPTFHNPTGATMPLARRQKLVGLGAEYGVVIVEDDAYGELRFDGQPLPHLAALDQEGWVVRIGTFSKILAPGMRMGYAYGRPEIIGRLEAQKGDAETGPYLTRVVAAYCADGRLDAHIATLRDHYRQKRDVMMDAIEREFPAGMPLLRPEGGFFIWCRLPEGVSARELLARSEKHGATFVAGGRCFANGQGDDAIRLAFSFQPIERIPEGIARIGAALRELL